MRVRRFTDRGRVSSSEKVNAPQVVNVAAGVERTDGSAPRRDARHEALQIFIGTWINEGHTIATTDVPSIPIVTSDIYEWAPGGFFVVHSAYGKIGDTSVGGLEVIAVDGDSYSSTFYDSFGNVHTSRIDIDGDVITWRGDRTRCRATMTDGGSTQTAHHELLTESGEWTPSMDVTLRLVR
jgi:hypothetical protein